MSSTSSSDVVNKLLELEPFLASDAKRSLQALRGLMGLFPGQNLVEIEKAVRLLVQSSCTSIPAMTERARSIVSGDAGEIAEVFLRDAKKLGTSELSNLAKALGFTLSGTKAKMTEELGRWLESRGKILPVSPADREAERARCLAAPLKSLMQPITPANADRILQAAEAAYKDLKVDGFRTFARELGITVSGAKAAMKKQLKDIISGLAVTHVQTQF